jgi:hypothetical protein
MYNSEAPSADAQLQKVTKYKQFNPQCYVRSHVKRKIGPKKHSTATSIPTPRLGAQMVSESEHDRLAQQLIQASFHFQAHRKNCRCARDHWANATVCLCCWWRPTPDRRLWSAADDGSDRKWGAPAMPCPSPSSTIVSSASSRSARRRTVITCGGAVSTHEL